MMILAPARQANACINGFSGFAIVSNCHLFIYLFLVRNNKQSTAEKIEKGARVP